MTRRSSRLFVVGAVSFGALSLMSAAHGQSITFERFRELVRDASSSEEALAELRAVDEVEGQAVDIDSALEGAEGEELRSRLRSLASAGSTATSDAAAHREQARSILSGRRYNPPDLPRPFAGVARRVGEFFAPVGRFLDRLAAHVPGGDAGLWIVLASAVIAIAVIVAARLASHKASVRVGPKRDSPTAAEQDPGALERAADAAEARGDFEAAIRLRFQAGLLRLGRAGVIDVTPSTTTGQIARALRSRLFSSLAATFEQITYGGRTAHKNDAESARTGWTMLGRDYAHR